MTAKWPAYVAGRTHLFAAGLWRRPDRPFRALAWRRLTIIWDSKAGR